MRNIMHNDFMNPLRILTNDSGKFEFMDEGAIGRSKIH